MNYCPNLRYDSSKKHKYTKPFSPRLESTIFILPKHELIKKVKNESIMVKEFVQQLSEEKSLLDVYNNLENENLTIGRRFTIKKWLDAHGAFFYSLGILKDYEWIQLIGTGAFSTASLLVHKKNYYKYVIKITTLKKHTHKINEMCRREIDILQNINHPYIIKLFYHKIIDDMSIIVSLHDYCNLGFIRCFY